MPTLTQPADPVDLAAPVQLTERSPLLERVALATLTLLALTLGFGDVAQVSRLDTLVLTTVHSLLPLGIALVLLSALRHLRLPVFPQSLLAPALVWLAIMLLSASLADAHRTEAIAALERPVMGVLLAWAVSAACRHKNAWLQLLHAFALGGLIVAVIALAEASGAPPVVNWLTNLQEGATPIGDVPRVAATLSHPNEAAMLLELSLPLLVAWAWTASPSLRLALAAAAAGTLLAIVLTFSRAGIAAALIALSILGAACVMRHQPRRLVPLALAALIVPLAFFWASLADPGLDRRLSAGVDESSAQQPARTEFWSVSLAMLSDHPWLGVGPDNYRWQFTSYTGLEADNLGIHAHDQYLEALADTGVLGLVSFGWLVVTLLSVAVRRLRNATGDWPWRAALLASLAAWLLHALLDDFERFWPTSVAFWLLAGLIYAAALSVKEPEDQPDDRHHHQQHQNPRRAAERGAATTAAETHHSGDIVVRHAWPVQDWTPFAQPAPLLAGTSCAAPRTGHAT